MNQRVQMDFFTWTAYLF